MLVINAACLRDTDLMSMDHMLILKGWWPSSRGMEPPKTCSQACSTRALVDQLRSGHQCPTVFRQLQVLRTAKVSTPPFARNSKHIKL